MWYGTIAAIPAGWALCNGSNGTPNLRDKFIVGAKQDSGGIAKTNVLGSLMQTGGEITHNHDISGIYSTSPGTEVWTFEDIYETTTVPPFFALAFIMKL